jgi:peptidyl-prolyl cis-trans isomerase B (cyclophilin B)
MKKFSICITALLFMFFTMAVNAQTKKTAAKKAPAKKAAVKKPAVKKVANAPKLIRVPGVRVKITTDSGVIIVRLYDKTPKHRDNFIKLANEHFFDSLLFHRVINEFMIQGGDPLSKNAPAGTMLGSGDVGYTIPAEFDTSLFHKKGALAAARTDNPEKASSGCQFYIVQGKKYTDAELNMIEMQAGIKFSPAKRNIYKTIGGTPFLDMNYTVFGEVESGLEVVDKIASLNKDVNNRPLGAVRMYVEVIK